MYFDGGGVGWLMGYSRLHRLFVFGVFFCLFMIVVWSIKEETEIN